MARRSQPHDKLIKKLIFFQATLEALNKYKTTKPMQDTCFDLCAVLVQRIVFLWSYFSKSSSAWDSCFISCYLNAFFARHREDLPNPNMVNYITVNKPFSNVLN